MSTDRELLEAAARAAGLHIDKSETNGGGRGNTGFDGVGNAVLDWHNGVTWNPLTDDGDALRLAVKLRLEVVPVDGGYIDVCLPGSVPFVCACECGDPYTATRRAIVRAAAAMAPTPKEKAE